MKGAMFGRIAKWLAAMTASGIAWWLVSLAGGAIAAALVGNVSGMDSPWIYVFVGGVGLGATGVCLIALRFGSALALARWPQLFEPRHAAPRRATASPPKAPPFTLPAEPKSVYNRLTKQYDKGRGLANDISYRKAGKDPAYFDWYITFRSTVANYAPEYLREVDELHDSRALDDEAELEAMLEIAERIMKDPKHR